MSIYTTQYISRDKAICRIQQVSELVVSRRYRDIEQQSFEPEYNVDDFVNDSIDFNIFDVVNWSNNMLSDKMDEPFYRFSMFDNYLISE